MTELSENVFDYCPDKLELDILNLFGDVGSYVSKLTPLKRLGDLQLLFIMRNDEKNRKRILNEILDVLKTEPQFILPS